MPKIANIMFSQEFFEDYIKNIFGESFAHSSLSFEKSFEESKRFAKKLKEFISPRNIQYAQELENSDDPNDHELLAQRIREARGALIYYQIPEHNTINDDGFEVPGVESFERFLIGCVRPYRNTVEYRNAQEQGKLTGAIYESETLLFKAQELRQLILGKVQADLNAKLLKRANNDAFQYALSLEDISIQDIKRINALVNNSLVHAGYKSVNNQINDCPFETCPKEYVPTRMQELMHKYNNEWAREIPEFIDGVSSDEEKEEYLNAVCEREAKFHIEFERIHPFEDGNGRTGRIILNSHLIKNEIAPILITPEMREYYIQCIDENDYKKLGKLIYMLSSVSLNDMMSVYRKTVGIKPDDLSYQEIGYNPNK